MKMFAFTSAVRGYHGYQDVWKPSIGEKLVAKQEFDNPMDKHAGQLNGQPFASWVLPNSIVFSTCGKISVEVIGHRLHL